MASDRSDVELLTAWRGGDLKAGSALFKRYFTAVRRFYSTTVESSAIEDLVQRTFVACVEKRDQILDESNFKAYLFGIAHNQVRMHYRSRARRETPIDFAEHSVADLGEGPSTKFDRKRGQQVLVEALRRIPLDQQVILQLRYWETFSIADLADFLAIPRNSVPGRIRRARTLLEAAIAQVDASPAVLLSTLRDIDEWASAVREQRLDDPLQALAELLPATLGARPLVERASEAAGQRFSYRRGASIAELRIGASPTSAGQPDPADTQLIVVQGFRGRSRWDPDTREATATIDLGPTWLELRVQPASTDEALHELLAELDLVSLAQHSD